MKAATNRTGFHRAAFIAISVLVAAHPCAVSADTFAQVGGNLLGQGLSWNRAHGRTYKLLERAIEKIFLRLPPLPGDLVVG
jgi:hypothetical protein